MSAVLGVSALYHDAAAALVVGGQVAAAVQEERLSRRKNDPSLPLRAARAVLARAGVAAADLDAVVFYEDPFLKLERVLVSLVREFPKSFRQFAPALKAQLGQKLWVLDLLSEGLGVPRERVRCVRHHQSHAASAFFASPFERAAVLTVDGVGEDASTALWLGEGRSLTCLLEQSYPHSLGLLYAALTAYLGFRVNEDEYKVMGLAAFGQPRRLDEFRRLVRVHDDGSFELDLGFFDAFTDTELGFGPALERLLGPRRAPSAPWDLARSAADQAYADVAASLQVVTEEILLNLARRARRETGAEALCLAGGVALNAVANARLLRDGGFARVFVQPAAGDAGGALGAAMLGALDLGDPRPAPLTSAALGLDADPAEALALAERLGLSASRVDDPAATAAELLSRGLAVGLVAGRFEWGPRALGQRSILAPPHPASMRDHLNRVVKQREPFRPFAPAILAERASDWFEGVDPDMSPFMTTVGRLRSEPPAPLDAVVHVDGTARLQRVSEASAPALAAVLRQHEALTGLPVVLNTSLNGPGEPICASALDAVAFLARHPLDALLVGDVLVKK